jgi:hypothetical protein
MLKLNEENWEICGRKENCSFSDGIIRIIDAFAVNKETEAENFVFELSARSPENAPKTELWVSFRRYSRDYHYMAGLRGDGHNHLYLARFGSGGYDKLLAVTALDFSVTDGIWYRIKIVCAGQKIAVYLNGEETPRILCEDTDAPFSSGAVAVGGGYTYAEYKDISVDPCKGDMLDGATAVPDLIISVTPSKEEKESMRRRNRALYRPFPVPRLPDERLELSLEGDWLFIPEQEAGNDPAVQRYDDSKAHTMHVPECWIPYLAWLEGEYFPDGKMGKGQSDTFATDNIVRCQNYTFDWQETQCAWYRHYIDLPEGIETKNVTFDFEGIALVSEIYINGTKVRENIGMFTPMQIDVSDHVHHGRNVIAVKVNRTVPDSEDISDSGIDDKYTKARDPQAEEFFAKDCEHRPFNTDDVPHGFYSKHPGGIWRSVKLIIRDKLYTDNCWFRPRTDGATIEVTVANTDSTPRSGKLSYSLVHSVTGECLCKNDICDINLEPGQKTTVKADTPVVKPLLWEPGKPNLYMLSLTVSDKDGIKDVHKEKVGFRTVGISGNQLTLNGRPLWVRGGNHFPAHVMPNDRRLARNFIKMALENNVIATRTHASPWNDIWLDSADEQGMMVSYEGTWGWLMLVHIPSERSLDIWKTELRALYMRHRNRPSVCIITMNNEMNFYLTRGSDETIREKAYHVQGGLKIAREVFPDLPLICDSGYNRAPTLAKSRDLNFPFANGRYERIIQKNGFDDGDIDDPHFYYGWYDIDFFHFMNGDFGWRETIPGRPCLLQELSVGYCRDEDGHAVRSYTFSHQTPQTTAGKRAYEFCDPEYFLQSHSFQVKGLAETFRRVEHERVCGILLFAYETWFYYHCDPLRIQPMISAKKLKTAYQPVLACAELYSRHFKAGREIDIPVTVINDDRDRDILFAPEVEVSIETESGKLASSHIVFDDIPYFGTEEHSAKLRLPDTLPGGAVHALLKLKAVSGNETVSQNEYDIFIAEESWADPEKNNAEALCLCDDENAAGFLDAHHIKPVFCNEIPGKDKTEMRLVIAKKLDAESCRRVYAFACAGGKVIMLNQRYLDKELTGGKELKFVEDATETITMNMPENSVFRGIGESDIAWFDNGKSVPYAAYGRYDIDRFDKSLCALAETLHWHNYIGKPTDYAIHGGTPLLAVKCGDGCMLISSVRTDADGKDPVARRFTDNILTWDFDIGCRR